MSLWDALGISDPDDWNRPEPQRVEAQPEKGFSTWDYAKDILLETGAAAVGNVGAFLSAGAPSLGSDVGSMGEWLQSNTSDEQKALRARIEQTVQDAKDRGEWGVVERIEQTLSSPLRVALPALAGSYIPALGAGSIVGRAASAGLQGAERVAATSAGRLAGAAGFSAGAGAGSVRGGYYDEIQKTPDAELQQTSPYYAELRQRMGEKEAKEAVGIQLSPTVAATSALGGGIGLATGMTGLERTLLGPAKGGAGLAARAGRAATTGLTEGLSEAGEEGSQQALQNVAVGTQTPTDLWKDVPDAAAQGGIIGLLGGGMAGLASRGAPPKTDDQALRDIANANNLDQAADAALSIVDKSNRNYPNYNPATGQNDLWPVQNAGISPGEGERLAEPSALAAADTVNEVSRLMDPQLRAAQAEVAQQYAEVRMRLAQPPPSMREPAPEATPEQQREQGLDQMQAQQAQSALQQPVPEAQATDLATGQVSPPLQGPMQAGFAKLQGQLGAPATQAGGQPAVQQVPSAANPQVVQPPNAPVPVAQGGGVPVQGRQAPIAPPLASPVATPLGAVPPSPTGGVLRTGRQADRPVVSPGVAPLQQAFPDAKVEEAPDSDVPEARAIRNFASIFNKQVVFFKGLEHRGATFPDNDTIYLNADKGKEHHLVVAGHEIGHNMRRENPELYAELRSRLRESITTGNLQEFAKSLGQTQAEASAAIADPGQYDALVEEFVSDLIGNRVAEMKTTMSLFAAGKKDDNLMVRVGKYILDYIDGLLRKITRTGYETDKYVKDLQRMRRDVRSALVGYAQESAKRAEPSAKEMVGPPRIPAKPQPKAPSPPPKKVSKEEYQAKRQDVKLSVKRENEKYLDKRISPRMPTAKKAVTEDASAETKLQPDLATFKRDPKAFEHNIGIMAKYPNFTNLEGTAEQKAEKMVGHMVDNLLWLHDEFKADLAAQAKQWYVGGQRISDRWSKRFGISPEHVAGIIAATSPQKDWFQNVSLAERMIDGVLNHSTDPWTPAMTKAITETDWGKKAVENPKQFIGKTLRDIHAAGGDSVDYNMAVWLRARDEAVNPQHARVITPEGDFLDRYDQGKKGPKRIIWQSFPTLIKTVKVLRSNGRPTAISRLLSANHKVRSFYNNIIAPNAGEDVTIDTHAVAAALLRPLGSNSREVKHNFGTSVKGEPGISGSAITGLNGSYALYAEAYRRAAEKRGLLPREMQSITWEAVRGMFRPEQKRGKIPEQADSIWSAKERDDDKAREAISELVGGITEPAWGSDSGRAKAPQDSSYARVVPGRGRDEGAAGSGRGTGTARVPEKRVAREKETPAPAPRPKLSRDREGRDPSRSTAPLEGAPTVQGATGPDPRLVEVLEQYARDAGIKYTRQTEYAKVDQDRARRIAAAYEAMPHAPNDPKVKAAYADLIKQTTAQYRALEKAGYKFFLIDETNDPYEGNPWNAMRDLRANQSMGVFATEAGFGTKEDFDASENPLLADTGIKWPYGSADGKPKRVLANDLFRAVHDAFGHGIEGAGFRPQGEENAWQAHARLFTGPAVGAITSETRGQNSWLNFGPHGEKNQTAKVEDTVFADQKTGLMPPWTWSEGLDSGVKLSVVRTPPLDKWFGNSKIVDRNGNPKVMYHGTGADFNAFEARHRTGAIYVTANPEFASDFAKASAIDNAAEADDQRSMDAASGANVMPVLVKAEKPFDYDKSFHVAQLKGLDEDTLAKVKGGKWQALEKPEVQKAIKAAGFDAFWVTEMETKNLAVYEPTQLKSATGNRGTFDPKDSDIRLSKKRTSYGTLTPEEAAAVANVVSNTDETMRERMERYKANLGLRITQGVFDQFAAIKNISMEDYIRVRMSQGTDGAVEAHLLYGMIEMDKDGTYDVKIDPEKGFARVLADLGDDKDRFLLWVAAQRADRLKKEGKENLFTDKDISVLKGLNKGREQKFSKALVDLNRFNQAILKIGLESGLIDQEGYDVMKDQPYVPFYRLLQDEKAPAAAKFSNAITGQYASKKLKGGKSQLQEDLLANVMQNWAHVISAAAKNRAAIGVIDKAVAMDIAYKVEAGTKNAVKIMRDGKTEHYSIEDPYLYQALTAVHASLPGFMKPLATAKRWMTLGVTANPAYRIRNILRDSISAVGQSDLSYNIPKNMLSGWKANNKNSQTYASMLASGAILRFGSMTEGNQSSRLQSMIDSMGPNNTILNAKGFSILSRMLKQTWNIYQELGDKAENANRAALYEQLIAKGYSKKDAAFASRDLLDFGLQGGWPVVRFFTQSVPFLNARLQGLYALGRAGKRDPRKFLTMAGAVALGSLALMLMNQDDEDWKQREDWDRDTYWWFKIGKHVFRVPKPFELGAIGTVVERSWELADPKNKEMTSKRFRARMAEIVSQQFAINPVPQIVKPLWEIYANRDSFTGRPIETPGVQHLRPQDRATDRTSSVARLMGQLGLPDPAQLISGSYKPLSPVQVDHMIKGYLGWAGVASATMADELGLRGAMGEPPRAARNLRESFLIGNFLEKLPAGNSRYVTQLYERSKEIEQVYASWREAVKEGNLELAKELGTPEMLKEHGMLKGALKSVTAANKQAKQVQQDRTLTPAEKRERLDEISRRRNEAARAAQR